MTMPEPDADSRLALQDLLAREQARYLAEHPRSLAMASQCAPHYLFGLPMHWMRDWPLPAPLFVAEAQGARLRCVDGRTYADFCLGDTGAMFGHSPPAVADALARQAGRGLTAMLPGEDCAPVGAGLAACFGLPRWQIALSASDANRFVLRWARAITGRPKVLVFDGCYHGTVDDTLVDLRARPDGTQDTVARASLLGQVHDLAQGTVVVPFNDAETLRRELAGGEVACVLAEPALTNCGLVLPQADFWPQVMQACRDTGTLLAMDETHTLSTAWGGWCRAHGLQPDFLVVGKAVAGGMPAAAYGFTGTVAQRMEEAKRRAPDGHSGIGTTLSANLLAMAALRATLEHLMTPENHARMEAGARRLSEGLETLIAAHALPWCVTRLGARLELQFCARAPRDAGEARAAMDEALEQALHLFLLNRGLLITPFHNMMLVSPATEDGAIDALLASVAAFVQELAGRFLP